MSEQPTPVTADSPAVTADDDALSFRSEGGLVLDLLFDDRRVWSIAVDDFPEGADGRRRAEWPAPIKRQLDGEVTLDLREHVSGRSYGTLEARFGSGEGRVEIVDSAGRPVALTKWGRMNHPFDTTDRSVVEGYLDQVEDILGILKDECGLPAFLAFGSLLGAVREGRLIGHDVDCDLGYFSRHDHPADIIRESFAVERLLRAKGYETTRENGGFLALFLPQKDGTTRNLDIFTAFARDGHLYQVHDIATKGGVDDVLPLGSVEFEGRTMPAPRNPETFMLAAYGPDWRIPNPAFKFETPKRDKRRVNGWFGGLRERRDFWARTYNTEGRRIPRTASTFAQWVGEQEQPGTLVDVGCGNGRDTRHFAKLGFDVTGLDLVPSASTATLRGMPQGSTARVETFNLESMRQTLAAGARFARRPGPVAVYGRFLIHALSESARPSFWRFASMAVRHGGRVYLEFRTERDEFLPKAFGQHYRRFLSAREVAAEAAQQGLRVVHQEQGRGLAPFEDEDPHLCRLILEYTR